MKIRDGNTFKELKIKAEVLDTLPIGSVIDYEGNTVPEGWEEVIDNGEVIVSATEPSGDDRKKVWLQHSENLFDGILELGDINGTTGQEIESTTGMRSKNYIDVSDLSTVSFIRKPEAGAFYIVGYDANKNYLGIVGTNVANASYIRFTNPNNANLNTKIKIEAGSSILPDKTYILNTRNTYEEYIPNQIKYHYEFNGYLSADQTIAHSATKISGFTSDLQFNTYGGDLFVTLCLPGYLTQDYTATISIGLDGTTYRIITMQGTSKLHYTGTRIFKNLSAGTHTLNVYGLSDSSSYNLIIPKHMTTSISIIEL